MKFKDVISITGKPGLFELITARQDGLIVTAFGEEKKTFISSRKHLFTPLENIGIYLDSGDTVPLAEVMQRLDTQADSKPESGANSAQLKDFFKSIVEDFDEDKVYVSDIKKILKWHTLLNEHGVDFTTDADEEE